MSTTITLLEHVATRGRVDRQAGIIYGVKILGRVSVNRRQYSDSALDDCARLYENRKVCLDHNKKDPRRERGILEEVAVIRNAKRQGDGVYGDLHLFQKHAAYPLLLERADKFPDTFGLSHNADGKQSRDGRLIESISHVRSVDFVADPATASSLFESRSAPSIRDGRTFADLCRGDSLTLVESADNTNPNQPTAGQKVQDQSGQVDSAVAAALDEMLPATDYLGLKLQGGKSIGRAFQSFVAFVAKDDIAPAALKNKAIKDAMAAKDDALAAFQKLVAMFSDDPATDDSVDYEPPTMESRNAFSPPRGGEAFARMLRQS